MSLGLVNNTLLFEFPDIHETAVLEVTFHRTLRVPDDGRRYNLPPSEGRFPLQPVDELSETRCPPAWRKRGGVAFPMWPDEACWIGFRSRFEFPFAVKVATGKVNVLTGGTWNEDLDTAEADYIEVPGQPWLDGYCVRKGLVRQFVATPLGGGHSVEEQISGKAEYGGIQILVRPMLPEIWRERLAAAQASEREKLLARQRDEFAELERMHGEGRLYRHRHAGWIANDGPDQRISFMRSPDIPPMGLGAGVSVLQNIRRPIEDPEVWDHSRRGRCFVDLAPAKAWRMLTGDAAPIKPPGGKLFTPKGVLWFRYVDPVGRPRLGSKVLAAVRSPFREEAEPAMFGLFDDEEFDPPEPVLIRPSQPSFARQQRK